MTSMLGVVVEHNLFTNRAVIEALGDVGVTPSDSCSASNSSQPLNNVGTTTSTKKLFTVELVPPTVPIATSTGRLVSFRPQHGEDDDGCGARSPFSFSSYSRSRSPSSSSASTSTVSEAVFLDYADTKGTHACLTNRPDLAAIAKRSSNRRRKASTKMPLYPIDLLSTTTTTSSSSSSSSSSSVVPSPPLAALFIPYYDGTIVLEYGQWYIVDSPNVSELLTLPQAVVDSFFQLKRDASALLTMLSCSDSESRGRRENGEYAVSGEAEGGQGGGGQGGGGGVEPLHSSQCRSLLGCRIRFQLDAQHRCIQRLLRLVAQRSSTADADTQTDPEEPMRTEAKATTVAVETVCAETMTEEELFSGGASPAADCASHGPLSSRKDLELGADAEVQTDIDSASFSQIFFSPTTTTAREDEKVSAAGDVGHPLFLLEGEGSLDAVRGAQPKLSSNHTNHSAPLLPGMSVKVEPMVEQDSHLRGLLFHPEGLSDEQLAFFMRQGSWSFSGTAQVAYFFYPDLTLVLRNETHAQEPILENATPPALSQGDTLVLEIRAYWMLQGTEVQLDMVDTDMNTVTRYVCKLQKQECLNDVVVLDDLSLQSLVTFRLTLLPFAMDELCELCLRLTVTRQHAAELGSGGHYLGQSWQSCTLTSRPILIREQQVTEGVPCTDNSAVRTSPSINGTAHQEAEDKDAPVVHIIVDEPDQDNVAPTGRRSTALAEAEEEEEEVVQHPEKMADHPPLNNKKKDLEVEDGGAAAGSGKKKGLMMKGRMPPKGTGTTTTSSMSSTLQAIHELLEAPTATANHPHRQKQQQQLEEDNDSADVTRDDPVSRKYWVHNVLGVDEKLLQRFIDPGRSNVFASSEGDKRRCVPLPGDREVIVVDVKKDPALAQLLAEAQKVTHVSPDTMSKATLLMWLVAVYATQCESALPEVVLGLRGQEEKKMSIPVRAQLHSRKRERSESTALVRPFVPIGTVRTHLCRHRALLYKFLCDHCGVPCFLARGEYREDPMSPDDDERHTWAVVLTDCNRAHIVDLTLNPLCLMEWPNPKYVCDVLTEQVAQALEPTATGSNHNLLNQLSIVRLSPEPNIILVDECGKGAVATVFRCLVGGLLCACKVPRTAADVRELRNEYAVLSVFRDIPHIVQCYGWCYKGILLEYRPFSLLAFMNMLLVRRSRMGENQIKQVLKGICQALVEMHSRGYVHRDIKAENVLVNVMRCVTCVQIGTVCKECGLDVVVADLTDGIFITITPPEDGVRLQPPEIVGTPPYASPEIDAGKPFTFASDVWSLGIIAHEMHHMTLPKEGTVKGTHVASPYEPGKMLFVPALRLTPPPPEWLETFTAKCLVPNWKHRETVVGLKKLLM